METLEVVRKSSTGSTRLVEQVFFTDIVNSQSAAALILLNQFLRKQDVDYISEYASRFKRVAFSRTYLTEQKELNGDLVCSYCGTPHLIIELDGMNVHDQKRKATIDHIVPLANGVNFYDKNNLCVSCAWCNSRKGHLSVEQFKFNHKLK